MGTQRRDRSLPGRCSMLLLGLLIAMCSVSRPSHGETAWAADCDGVQQYRMQSVLEYSGKTQFCNKADTIFTANKHQLSDEKVRYVLSTDRIAGIAAEPVPSAAEGMPSSLKELSFVIDRKNQHLSQSDNNLALLEKVANQCAASLKKVTGGNVGKTWKQDFDLSAVGESVPGKLTFTLTAIPIKTQAHGKLIAVRALSEPFPAPITGGTALCRMNCAYVFCPAFEEIFFSASVFGAMTNCNGYSERLKHTVTTWKVDAAGEPAKFDELGRDKDFARLIGKLGVSEPVRVVKAAPLPQWARSEGVRAAQVANLCASVSCEGALNPVATIYLPAASTVGLQSFSESLTLNKIMTAAEGSEVPAAAGGEEVVWWPPWANIGWNWPTAAWGVGLGVGGAAIGGAFDSDHDDDVISPIVP